MISPPPDHSLPNNLSESYRSEHVYKTLVGAGQASVVAQTVKNPFTMQKTWVRSLGWADALERAGQPTPVFLPGESPWTEEPGGLQFMGSQRVRDD